MQSTLRDSQCINNRRLIIRNTVLIDFVPS